MATADQLCHACAALNLVREDFVEPPFERGRCQGQVVLEGSLGILRQSENCPLCHLILYTLSKSERGVIADDDEVRWALCWDVHNPEYEPTRQNEDLFGSGLYAYLVNSGRQSEYRIELVDDDPASGFLRARRLTQDVTSIDRLRGWIRACKDAHGIVHTRSYFKGAMHPLGLQNFRVIDVHKQCLTILGEVDEYIALSYVWGMKNTVLTTKANVEEFSSEDAFSKAALPRTIRDAIDLTYKLGFSYLWIDSLCIVQDDQSLKPQLIANMGRIYANATVTIIAATGTDADAGLSGLDGRSKAMTHMPIRSLGPQLQLGVLPHLGVELLESHHATRGWTFQETCLSPRCLLFLNGSVYFSCINALLREDVVETLEAHAAYGTSTTGRDIWNDPLQRYAQLVEPYNERNLTFDSDGLNAFAGVLDSLSEPLSRSRMFYGIPAAVFDWGLLWMGLEELSRRISLPSWAWAGVSGRLMLPMSCGVNIEQVWLLRRTWIDWYIVYQSELNPTLVWAPERDDTIVAELIGAEDQKYGPSGDDNQHAEADAVQDKSEYEGEDENDDVDVDGKNAEEEEDEEEEEDDDDTCPTYGLPSPASLYGRRNTVTPSMWPPKPPDDMSTNSIPQCISYPDGTLYFTTLSARFKFDAQFLLDLQGRKCGVLRGPTLKASASGPTDYEVLILSWASPGTTGSGHWYTRELDEEYRVLDEARSEGGGAGVEWEPLIGDWHAWAYFNVLVVRPYESSLQAQQHEDADDVLLERFGIGLLHVRALDQLSEDGMRWRKVWLY